MVNGQPLIVDTSKYLTKNNKCLSQTYLIIPGVFPPLPLGEPRTPVFQHVRLGVLAALPLAEAALRLDGRDDVHPLQIDLQVLVQIARNHVLRTPGASIVVHFQSASGQKRRKAISKLIYSIKQLMQR